MKFGMYNANAADLKANLAALAGTPVQTCGGPCTGISYNQMIPVEFATSSSLELATSNFGNGYATSGDAQTPASTLAGHAQWTLDTMCALWQFGIPVVGYFGEYDSLSWWEENRFAYGPISLAWVGFLGLSSEISTAGDKPAWNTFTSFNPANPGCSGSATPIVALQPQAPGTNYVIGERPDHLHRRQ